MPEKKIKKVSKTKKHNELYNPAYKPVVMLQEFLKMEAAGGFILIFFAALAMITANTSLQGAYNHILHESTAIIGIGGIVLEKTIIHWINDGLMAVFFFLVGLEIKREVMEGALSSRDKLILPIVAAVGGMIVPGIIFYALNPNPPEVAGWAIPTATDIAFALGILSILGKRVPVELKVFLLALAIIDDLGAILIITLFYTGNLDVPNLAYALIFVAGLMGLNYFKITKGSLYLLFGIGLWIYLLKSGVHATLAGVITAFAIPLTIPGERRSLLRQLEHDINPFVAFFILPVFAFANAGISFEGMSFDIIIAPVTLGVILGLIVGKPLGITFFTWLFVKLKIAKLPDGINIKHVFAVSLLAGIGFTMSIFIGTLGYMNNQLLLTEAKLGIVLGSAISAVVGLIILSTICRKKISSKTLQDMVEKG